MSNQIIKNKKAFHNYEVLDRFEAGIALEGTEVKSLREGGVKILEAFCRVSKDFELTLHQLEISHYKHGNIHNHDPHRVRKLLMHKREIFRIGQKMQEKGLSLIPIGMYFKRGRVKVEIALCKGKKMHDKRDALKARDQKMEIARAMKGE